MKINETKLLKLVLLVIAIIVVTYNLVTENYGYINNLMASTIVIVCSAYNVIKCRKSYQFLILGFVLFYFNYSTIMYHYLFFAREKEAFMVYANSSYSGAAINYLAIFWIVWVLCFKYNKIVFAQRSFSRNYFCPKNVIILLSVLLFIFIFGINRTRGDSYMPNITPIYEYSYIFFLFAFYYAGKNKILRNILLFFAALFILQDLYLGGRVSSLQLTIVILIQVFPKIINGQNILLGSGIGLMLMNVIAIYRVQFNTENISIKYIVTQLIKNFGVLDTAYYAYYSSITHFVLKEQISFSNRITNFIGFLGNIIGIDIRGYMVLSPLANRNGYVNMGGGWYFSYFAYWMGVVGVIVSSLLLVSILNYLNKRKSSQILPALLIIIICASSFRWYLYTPLAFYRNILLTIIVHFLFLHISKHSIKKNL